MAYRRGSNEFRQASKHFFLLLILLGFFGCAVDMVHIIVTRYHLVAFLVRALEDGGGMIVMRVIAWYASLLVIREGQDEG